MGATLAFCKRKNLMNTEKADILRQAALNYGALDAVLLSSDDIITNPELREICRRNACGRYDRCYMCPPDLGEVEELIEKIRAYPYALIYQSLWPLEDPFDFEGMMDGGEKHQKLSINLNKAAEAILEKPFLHLSSGCKLCEKCAKTEGAPCRHPKEALGPVEGYCIDVAQTIRGTQLKYINGENTVTYFGIIFFAE